MSENTEAQVLEKLQESFCSEAWEKFSDYTMETMKRLNEYTTNLETLETNIKSLTAKASGVNEQIKNGEASGKKKRKREVENWLKEVEKIESELVVLQNEVNEPEFLNQFLGNKDRVERLNGRIRELLEESEYFGELLEESGKPSYGGKLLKTLGECFSSKVWEKLVDEKLAKPGWEAVTGRKDSEFMLETLQTSLNSLSDKAWDIKEQIRHGEQLGKKKRKREVENWLKEVQKIESELSVLQNQVQEEGFLSRFFGEDRVSELNARVHALIDQSHHFGELLLDASEMKGEPMLTSRLFGEAFEKNTDVIWKWLVIDKVKSIGIYGIGGVGKTTLAMHINNRLLKETQLSVYWITVSQKFTIEKLQSDIAKVVDLDLSDEENIDKRAARLNQALSNKKEDFVLILDDVWSDIDLEQMGDPLGVDGCRLIVTTRSLGVCQRIDCREIIKVETLKTDESWTLFRQTLGERIGEWMGKTSGVEDIAKSLAKECDGFPLGIKVLANYMKGVPTYIHVWRDVLDEICKLDEMEEKVFRVLKYSFDRLDPKLQLCFLYCSLYPEDYDINKHKLVRRFISEELVDKKSLEKQLDQGYTMLSTLVDLCLLESTGDSKSVKMHDLVRDMALNIARESPKYKVFAGLALKEIPNEGEWTEDVDKISLMHNEIEEISTFKF